MARGLWSTPTDVIDRLRRRWDRAEFLSQFASGLPWTPLGLNLTGPGPGDIVDRFDEVHAWVDRWRRVDPQKLRVEKRALGGRLSGGNQVPGKVWIDSYDNLWALLGVTREVRRFADLLDAARHNAPRIAEWMITKPLEVLRFADDWASLVETALWIDRHATSDMYLRQIDVPGVDTKFIERHRKILGSLLDRQLPAHRVDPTRPVSDFAARYRFRTKPAYVRFRRLGDASDPFTELTVRVGELAVSPPPATTVFVVENEITYLAFPQVESAIAIFGGGYAVSGLEPLTWLAQRELVYWGDIDTHGFVILDQLRRRFTHTRSMLMDRTTLLTHQTHWMCEPSPTGAHLEFLHADEAALYADLVEDTFGPAIRLEQERVRYSVVEQTAAAISATKIAYPGRSASDS